MTLPLVSGEYRVGADPELRFSPSGVAVCNVRAVASSRKKMDNGDWVDDKTTWVTLTAFKELAQNIAESVAKGDLITATGRLHVENWESGDKKGTSVSVLVDSIGPSLKYATAKVSKTERTGGSSNTTNSGDSDPWEAPATQDDAPPF